MSLGEDARTRESGERRLSASVRRPLSAVLLLCLSGVVDEDTVAVIDEHLDAPAGEILHVVIDLRAIAPLTPGGVRALLDLDRRATHRGTVLHLAGADRHVLLQRLFDARMLSAARWCNDLLPGGPAGERHAPTS